LVLNAIANTLKYTVIRAVQNYRPWLRRNILNIHGVLEGVSLETNRSKAAEFTPLRSIDGELISLIIEYIHESRDDVQLFELEWIFTIPAATFIRGGHGGPRIPTWAPKSYYRDTWEDQGVNCAAYALVRLMENTKQRPRRLSEAKHLFIHEARDMALEFGW